MSSGDKFPGHDTADWYYIVTTVAHCLSQMPNSFLFVQGTEKVLLIQEQLSKNRVLIDVNNKGEVESSVTSSTHDRRSQTRVSWRRGVALVINTNFLT